jgi:hypothetical protein
VWIELVRQGKAGRVVASKLDVDTSLDLYFLRRQQCGDVSFGKRLCLDGFFEINGGGQLDHEGREPIGEFIVTNIKFGTGNIREIVYSTLALK